jgi:hypothetical protein
MIQGEAQMMKTLTDTMRRGLEAKRAEDKAQAMCGRGTGTGTGTGMGAVKPPKFNRTQSWTVFWRQFKTVADHNCWTRQEKSTYLITTLRGQATNMLNSPKRSDL